MLTARTSVFCWDGRNRLDATQAIGLGVTLTWARTATFA